MLDAPLIAWGIAVVAAMWIYALTGWAAAGLVRRASETTK